MPTGPKGQKRPADVIGNAIRVAKIATGEIEEEHETEEAGKDKAAADWAHWRTAGHAVDRGADRRSGAEAWAAWAVQEAGLVAEYTH